MFNEASKRIVGFALVALLTLVAVACDDAESGDAGAGGAAGSACLAGDEECYETGAEESPVDLPAAGAFDVEDARERAHGVLGMFEKDLPDEVRVARRGAESLPLTLDHVPGRLSVELDDTDGSGMRVVHVNLELPEGVERYQLEAG